MNVIDSLLNRITMYRIVLYYLIGLVLVAIGLAFLGLVPYSPAAILFSAIAYAAIAAAANAIFAWAFDAVPNVESFYITALILALIVPPPALTIPAVGALVFIAVWAMASKYIFAIGRRHLFNPAAFAVALAAFAINTQATWWVGGNTWLMPFVLVGGLLVIRKVQRFDLVLAFTAAALVAVLIFAGPASIYPMLVHSPFVFFAAVMLTEPLTTPSTRSRRILYGTFVGFFFVPYVHIGGFYPTPELALLAGNILSYALSPGRRFMLRLIERRAIGRGTYEFVFAPDRRVQFSPGQYMEWTLPMDTSDSRGNRRYFTVASSPRERVVRLGIKFYEPASAFKQKLLALRPGSLVSASHAAGDFTLPRTHDAKLAFISGGIGVTPMRSIVGDLLEGGERRPIVHIYSNRTNADIAYEEIFDRAERELGLRTIYAVTDEAPKRSGARGGAVDRTFIEREIPDWRERTFYLSGPRAMVDAFDELLSRMGVARLRIKTDFFPGFA